MTDETKPVTPPAPKPKAPPAPKPKEDTPPPAPVRLDRSRPFGTVFGLAGGGKYEQDGKLFNPAGELVK